MSVNDIGTGDKIPPWTQEDLDRLHKAIQEMYGPDTQTEEPPAQILDKPLND